MKGSPIRRRTQDTMRLALLVCLVACCVAATALCLAALKSGEPVALKPQAERKGQPVQLPRGEVLLFDFLQQLANVTGDVVHFQGDDPPQTVIVLPRNLRTLDFKTAREMLDRNGYEIRSEMQGDANVYRVERAAVRPALKGKIIRPGDPETEEKAERETPREAGAPAQRGDASPPPSLRLYAADDGGRKRFLVVYETDSRRDAEEALALLKSLFQ